MDSETAEHAARRVGLITLPIGVALVAAPAPVARLLGGQQDVALRVIGACDLALVPGLLAGRRRWVWMTARVGLNLAIAAHCLRLVRAGNVAAPAAAAGAMVIASAADLRAVAALRS